MNINFDGLVCYLNAKPSSKKQEQWIDSSSNNNNAILTNVSDNDFNGEYIQFTGNNYATLPRCIQDDFTISAEVVLERSTSTNDAAQAWFSYAALIDAEASGIRNDFGLTISKDGHAYFGVGNPDQTISYTQQSLFNKKHVITCTRHKTTGAIALYIDGNLIKKHFHPNKSSLTYSPSIYIGKGINNKYLLMKLFSVRLYNRVLNEFEIKQDMFLIKEKEYVNNNNLPKIVDKLSDASNIKIAGNKYGNRVQTVIDKIVEKADNVTKAINQEVVNNTHSFKVGTGNNVDVSTDVQDSFSEIAIKGQTYQNLYPKLNGSNYTNINAQFDRDIIKFTANGDWQNFWLKKQALMVKPNTTYTVVLNILKNTIVTKESDAMLYLLETSNQNGHMTYFTNSIILNKNISIGHHTFTVSTKNDFSAVDIATRCFLHRNATSGELWFRYALLEGDHANNSNLPSYFEGIVGVGDKSKNLLNPANFVSSNGVSITKKNMLEINLASDGGQRTIYKGLKIPKGQYTVTIEVIEGQYTGGNLIFYNSSDNKFSEVRVPGTHVVNTNNNDIDKLTLWAIKGVCKLRIQIEKGSVSTPYEPYYNGYKVEILSCGKNLYKPNLQTKNARGLTFSLYGNKLFVDGTCTATVDFRPINGTEKITLDLFNYVNKLPIGTTLRLSNNLGLKNYFSLKRNGVQTYPSNTLVIQEGDYDISCFVRFENGQTYKNQELKIQLEISSNANEFEPYQENKIQIFLDEPLMKLPNDVCDEITRDGKLIKRIGKIVLDGSNDEKWHIHDNKTNKRFRIYWTSNSNKYSQPAGWCNIIPFYENKKWQDDAELIELDPNYISIRKPFGTVEEFRAYLKANPVTVYYELQTPIVTDLSETQIKIFKDGHLTFNTLVAPESTHIVQLNKSAQVHNAIKQSQLLDNKITVLENNYDSLMLSTMSTLNDLEFDYTLK